MTHIDIEKAVVKTLSYFSLFHYPLTGEELFSYLWQPGAVSYDEFKMWLLHYHGSAFTQADGFYFLSGYAPDVWIRQSAVAYTEQKIRRALFGSKLIRWIPGLRAIFVCNSVAMSIATMGSDIDVFIVTSPGRTWWVRLLVTLILSVARLRRHGNHITDRLCLSFYSDMDHLNMASVALGADDIYLAYWLVQLVPVWDPEGIAVQIVQENEWMHSLVPNAVQVHSSQPIVHSVKARLLSGRVGSWLEKAAKKIQLRHIKKTSVGKNRPTSSAVVIEDGFLKFHETDRRAEYRDAWLGITRS